MTGDHIWSLFGGPEVRHPEPVIEIYGYQTAFLKSAELVSIATGEALLLHRVSIKHDQITWETPAIPSDDLAKHGSEHRLIATWQRAGELFTWEYPRVIIQAPTKAKAELPEGWHSCWILTRKPLSDQSQPQNP